MISEALVSAVSALGRLDTAQVSQVRQALLYFIQLILHRRSADEREELIELVKQHSQDESEVLIMAQTAAEFLIAQGIEQGKAQGIEQGEAQGIERGKAQGRQEAILRLLQLRFQNIPETLTEQITAIESLSHLDMLLEQVLTAQSLDEIQV